MPSAFPNENRRTARRVVFWRSAAALAAFALAGFACGPSVQSIYEGNVRFEHCYRLDLEVDTAPTHREACWKEWLGMYTYGQPLDRIEYARRRLHAFANGDLDRPTLDIGDAKKAEARQFYLVVPAPTSVHSSPPPIATRWYGDAGTAPAVALPASVLAPEDKCSAACHETYATCSAPCDPDAGRPDAACKACDPDYKACMKRCFR
ncbi:MAG: hypothetical protein ABI548_26900 [Polyangiaceae bacterium]